MIVRLLRKLGIDRATGYTAITGGWGMLTGPITLFLVTRSFSLEQQGTFYNFASVLTSLVLFELGLAFVLLQTASHEWAHLEWTAEETLTGSPQALARLASLLQASLRWYGGIAALVALIILPGGFLFFTRYTPASLHIAWQGPWVWTALVSVGSVLITPVLAILEGCGLVTQLSKVRLHQSLLSSFGLWLALVLGWGLYAVPIGATISWACFVYWLWSTKRSFLGEMLCLARTLAPGDGLDWRRDVWPFQWKIALSGISSYIIFSMFNPIIYATRGPAAAGQLGLSLSVMQTLGGIAMSWLVTKTAPYGALIAQRNWKRLDEAFFPTLWRSCGVVVLLCSFFWVLVFALGHFGYPISRRLIAPLPLGFLAAATIVSHVVGAEAIYLRGHKQEPFLTLSILVAVLIGLSNFFLAHTLGVTGMMLGYFVVYLSVGLGGGTWIFVQKRQLWHQPDPAPSS